MIILVDKYEDEWNVLLSKYSFFGGIKPTNPLLLNVPSSYFDADCKVMVFGQETNDWEGEFPHPGKTSHLLDIYHNFYVTGYCYNYGGQFWNGVSKFKNALTEKLRPSEKTVSILWNNLIKIGMAHQKGTPNDIILSWQNSWFDVISFEINNLEPNIVIFFSGPNYDKYIKRIYNDATFHSINSRNPRQLARVKSCRLPVNSIRTYHPNYLWRNGFYAYLNEIIDAINC